MSLKPKDANSNKDGAKKVELQLPVELLEIGMYVSRPDRPWTEVPVLMQGFKLTSPEELKIFQTHCKHVFIEVDEGEWKNKYQGLGNVKSIIEKPFEEQAPIHEELPKAKLSLQKTQEHIENILNDINNGDAFNYEESRQVVKSCMNSIIRNANAMLWLSKIKNEDKYTSEHCTRVGILSIAFGRFLGFGEREMELVGLCGMLHDVGKIKIPPEILNKPDKLTDEEYDIMKNHAFLGKQVLEEVHGVHELIKDTAHYHHERVDGRGYPDKSDANELHQYIRMVSIVDVYDAITSDRCYKSGKSAFEALKILFKETNTHFDKKLVEAFIRMIGIYPPGTLVEMTNGEVGIVISSNPNARLKPRVELVATAEKKFRSPYVIDLCKDPTDSDGNVYAIENGLPNRTYGIDIKDFIQM